MLKRTNCKENYLIMQNFRPKMSDDEDIQYIKRKKVVHFGTLSENRGESSVENIQVETM